MSVPREPRRSLKPSFLPLFLCSHPPAADNSLCSGRTWCLPFGGCELSRVFWAQRFYGRSTRRFLPSGPSPPGGFPPGPCFTRSASVVTDRSHPRDRLFRRSHPYFFKPRYTSVILIRIPTSDVTARLGLEAVALAWLSRAQA
jgi:hypothetical protein